MTWPCTSAGPLRARQWATAASKARKAGERVGAVDFSEIEIGEASDQRRDVAAGGIDLDRNGDGVAVVFDDEEDGELEIGGGADGFPELAFAGGAIAEGNVDDFVAVEIDFAELAVVARVRLGGFGMLLEVEGGFRAANSLEALGRCGRRRGDDVVLGVRPVGRHLAAAAGGVSGSADGLQEMFFDRGAEGEREGAIAVVGEKPVVAGAQREGGSDEESFVAGARDLEEDFLLIFEDDLAVVGAAREVHEAVNLDQFVAGERGAAAVAGGCQFSGFAEFSA